MKALFPLLLLAIFLALPAPARHFSAEVQMGHGTSLRIALAF